MASVGRRLLLSSRRLSSLRPAALGGASAGSWFRGVWPIVATPFRSDESLDLPSFIKSIQFFAAAGVNGVTIVGVLGESNRLMDSERASLIEAAVEVARSVDRPFRVCVGASHAGTHATVALSAMAQKMGADGVMVTPSKEPAPASDDAIVELFAAVERGCPGLPIVLQDHPASTQVFMQPPLLARISREVPAIACIKLESLPSPAKIRSLRGLWEQAPPAGNPVTILTGLGALYGGFDLEQGTEGFMTGFAFPEILIAMNDAAQAGDLELAHRLYSRFLPLMVFEQQPGVGVRKEIYRLRGLIESTRVRHPAPGAAPVLVEALERQIQRSLPGVDITKPLPKEIFV